MSEITTSPSDRFCKVWGAPRSAHLFSGGEVRGFAQHLVRTCGGGSVLDVGCGAGSLVRALLAMGVDAYGIDSSAAAVALADTFTPRRCRVGDGFVLDVEPASFDTVTCVGLIDFVSSAQTSALLAALTRVARRSVVLVAIGPAAAVGMIGEGAAQNNLSRAAVDSLAFVTGLRRHPMMMSWVYYDALGPDTFPRVYAYEKVPIAAAESQADSTARPSHASQVASRDFLRLVNPDALPSAARYQVAAELVRRGDVVLDIGCGAGCGSAILAAGSEAAGVIGVEETPGSAAYAQINYGGERLHFQEAQDLAMIPDGSVEMVVCVQGHKDETQSRLHLAECKRVLSPGGRIVVSIAAKNEGENLAGTSDGGFAAKDWLSKLLREAFLIEKCWSQRGGGLESIAAARGTGASDHEESHAIQEPSSEPFSEQRPASETVGSSNSNDTIAQHGSAAPPVLDAISGVQATTSLALLSLRQVPLDDVTEGQVDWWVFAAMKSPLVRPDRNEYRESMFESVDDAGYHLYRFDKDYDNPWLFRSMICMGPRMSDASQLQAMAQEVLRSVQGGGEGSALADSGDLKSRHDLVGSADHGAAVCVLAYQALTGEWPLQLETGATLADARRWCLVEIERFEKSHQARPHAKRWVISNSYVAGHLLLQLGERTSAKAEFARCASMDALAFSPLLGTKTVDAARLAGMLHAVDGEAEPARKLLQAGVREAQRLVSASWLNVCGRLDSPQPYGLYELSQVIDAASHCAGWLESLDKLNSQPGFAWSLAARQSFGDTRQYIRQLIEAQRWLESQLAERVRKNSEVALLSLTNTGEVNRRSELLHNSHRDLMTLLRAAEKRAHESADWAAQLEAGKAWLENQTRSLTEQLTSANAVSEQRLKWGRDLEEGTAWLTEQTESLRKQLADTQSTAALANQYKLQLEEGKRWLESHVQTLTLELEKATSAFEESKAWSEKVLEGKVWLERELGVVRLAERLANEGLAQNQASLGVLEAELIGVRAQSIANAGVLQAQLDALNLKLAAGEESRRVAQSQHVLASQQGAAREEAQIALIEKTRAELAAAEARSASLLKRTLWARLRNFDVRRTERSATERRE